MQNSCYFCKMKIKTVIFYTLPVLLCLIAQSCKRFSLYTEKGTPLHYSVLNTITDTMICCPEAALNILISVSDTVDEQGLSKPDYYEYQILIAEALYKNDFSQTNDSAVIEAVKFYDSLANIYPKNVDVLFPKARAHYYQAVGETEKDDIKSACEDYMVSLKTIDKIKGKDRNNSVEYFNGLIYNRLARIYYDFTNKVALKIYKNANDSFIKCHADYSVALNCISIAKLLSSDKRYEESYYYLSVADSIISKDKTVNELTKTKSRINILMARALNLCDSESKHYEALRIIKKLYDNANDDQMVVISAVLAEMYYQNNMVDSALYYYEMAFENNHYAKMTVASRIVEISQNTSDNDRIAHYAPLLAEETHKELEFTPLKAELIAMYEQYEADKHKEEIIDLWLKIMGVLVLLIIALVAVFYVVSIIRKRKHLIEINRKDWYIGTLHGKIKKTKVENEKAKESIKSLEDQLENQPVGQKVDTSFEPVSFIEKMRIIKTDELCEKLIAISQMNIKTTVQYDELVLSNEEFNYLINLFDKELDGEVHALIRKNSRLKSFDELVLCLTLLGLDNKHIAAVTGSSYHNVFVHSQKCLKALGEGEDLYGVMVSLMNQHQFAPSRG